MGLAEEILTYFVVVIFIGNSYNNRKWINFNSFKKLDKNHVLIRF